MVAISYEFIGIGQANSKSQVDLQIFSTVRACGKHDVNCAISTGMHNWEENSIPVFTGGIYWYFSAWKVRLKWQILANNGKYNCFAAKYWQI